MNYLDQIIGGLMIGAAASGMLWANGRIMGISGILGGLINPHQKDKIWRSIFFVGVLIGGFLIPLAGYTIMEEDFDRTFSAVAIGGVLVGFGTAVGGGCTSGHGVCGISRFSKRSIVATVTFMAAGILAVTLMGKLL